MEDGLRESRLLRRLTLGKLNVAEASSWTLGVVDFFEKVLGSKDICHHPDETKILTTTIRLDK